MTGSIGNLATTFGRAIEQIESQRSFAGAFFGTDDTKHVRFSAKKGLYLHKGVSGFSDAAAVNRARKRADGAKAIVKTLQNSVGQARAEAILAQWREKTGKSAGDLNRGMTLGDLKALRDVVAEEARSFTATLDGATHRSSGSPDFNARVSAKINTSLVKDLARPDMFKAHGFVHENMAKDFGRSRIIVDGTLVSGHPDDMQMSPEDQVAETGALFTRAGLPEHDTRVLSTVLHQGVFADMLTTGGDDPGDSPVPGVMSIAGNDETGAQPELATTITSIPDEPGAYRFVVSNKGPMSSVLEFPKGDAGPTNHQLANGSAGAFQMTGKITVGGPGGSPPPNVEVDTVDVAYRAMLST